MAFLGIRISHDIGRLLSNIPVPEEKVSPSEYHITLLYFGDNWPIAELAKAMQATYDVVSNTKPFLAKVEEVDCFNPAEDKPFPIITKVKSQDLHDLNDQLKKEFDKKHIEYSKTYKDYKPHITLAYAKDSIKKFKIDPVEFSIAELVLWGGDHGDDRIIITLPLKNPEKHSWLLQKTDIFQKLANNPNAVLTQSKERRKIER